MKPLSAASLVAAAAGQDCSGAYQNVESCPAGSSQGTPQADWLATSTRECKGPCDGYSTLQWTSPTGAAEESMKSRNGGSLVSSGHGIPATLDELRCWFRPDFSWGMQNGVAPPFNPQPEAAYLDDAGNGLGGGLPGPDSTVACCCQEECTMEMIELRHWIYQSPGCSNVDIDYNTDGNNGRVLLTRTSDRGEALPNTKHEACMCGDRTPERQLPFYYYVVQGPATNDSMDKQLWWLNSLRTAYSNLFDIWAQRPPCSGECLIMGGASDAWVTYGHSTARSILFQLRAFAGFDPHALPNACGSKGVMLRFGGMTLDGSTVTCNGIDGWGETGAHCPTVSTLPDDFQQLVTLADDSDFLARAGPAAGLTLETDRAVISVGSTGIHVREKADVCASIPQPTLDLPWRCSATGGVSDAGTCSNGAPTPTPTPPPSPPSPSPSPTPEPTPDTTTTAAPGAYTKHTGFNCYTGNGGTPLGTTDEPVSSSASVLDCQSLCEANSACMAFTRNAVDVGFCWLRSAVSLGSCVSGTGYDTYTKSSVLV